MSSTTGNLATPMERLSVELWTCIFQLVHDAAPENKQCRQMLPCMLVSKAWKSFTAPFLYQSISVTLNDATDIQSLNRLATHHIDLLENPFEWTHILRICKESELLTDAESSQVLDSTVSLLMLMPQLRTLCSTLPIWTSHLLLLPKLLHIVSIDVFLAFDISLSSALRVASSATNLTNLRLVVNYHSDVSIPDGFSCSFPVLEVLRLGVDVEDPAINSFMLLQHCSLPRLRTLGLELYLDSFPAELIRQLSIIVQKQTALVELDLDSYEEPTNALLGSSELVIPEVVTIHCLPWKSTIAILHSKIQKLVIKNPNGWEGPHSGEFVNALCQPSRLRELQMMDFAWRDGGNSDSKPELVGWLMSQAVRLEQFGVKVLDRDGATFKHAAPC